MSHKKEKLFNYLERHNYANLTKVVFPTTSNGENLIEIKSENAARKSRVNALKRYQTFSGLKPTGRVNKLTLAQTEKPYCSFPDVTTAEIMALSFSPPGWNTTNISYGFLNSTPQLSLSDVRNAIRRAFDLWKSAFSPFQFREISLDDGPMIAIRFVTGEHGDDFPFNGADNDLAHAFLPNDGGDIHFDDAESWGVNGSPTKKDLFTVAAHEIGHALGLGHSTLEASWMFKKYLGPRHTLHQEDVSNIRNLYS